MNKLVLFDIDHTLFDTPVFKDSQLTRFTAYSEVVDVLAGLKSIADLGVFSEGDLSLQTKKLLETKILDVFLDEHIYIFDRKLEHIDTMFAKNTKKKLYLVDDKQTVLKTVKEYNPAVQVIWIKRGLYAEDIIPGFTPDKTVKDLRDILSFITEN